MALLGDMCQPSYSKRGGLLKLLNVYPWLGNVVLT